jgi:hypothetical protein
VRRIHSTWLLGALIGCSGSTADVAILSLSDTDVSVDSRCLSSACQDDTPTLTISIPEDITVGSSASLELVQYRVDYTLPDLSADGTVPFFAAALDTQTVEFAGSATIDITPASDQQRDWVYALVGGAVVDGTATMTLQAYDELDELVSLSLDFDIIFADLAGVTTSSDTDTQ